MSSCGIGSWTGPKPGDPDNNSVLSATPTFGGINVSWTYPTTNPFAVAHVILYRAEINLFATAVRIGVVQGSQYFDALNDRAVTTYYYWIQFVSVNGTYGEEIGPASAIPRAVIEDVIEQLTAKIDSSHLATSLKSSVDSISTINTNLANEILDRQTGQNSLADAIAAANLGIADANTFIIDEIAERTTQNSAMVGAINGVAASLGDDIATAVVNLTALIDASGNTVSGFSVKLTVNNLVGGFGIDNNGGEVEAGFDVDTFWVGRTSADSGKKPFIIENDEVFINKAAISDLTAEEITVNSLEGGVSITGGGITLNNGGAVKSAGRTSYNDNTAGFFLGYTGNADKYGLDIMGTGQFRLRSATSGARLVIQDDVIAVFDSSGTLRVKIGNLAAVV